MSSESKEFQLPKFEEVPESEHHAMLRFLLGYCETLKEQLALQSERLSLQAEQIKQLRDEISILKGEKPRPKIKPSTLNKDKDDKSGGDGGGKTQKRGKPLCKKTQELEIHETKIIPPSDIPPGSIFKGYEDYVVQDIEIKLKNINFRRERYETPRGETVTGELPEWVKGTHFGPILRGYVLSQYYEQHVPQRLVLKQLWQFGVRISAGQLNSLIIERHEPFHEEKEEVLRVGLRVSSYVNVDDTAARHKGRNGYCTHIGNELFAWFSSTESKSRINFLELLCVGHSDYVVDEIARQYMEQQKLPALQLELLSGDRTFSDKASFAAYLTTVGLLTKHHRKVATEGALLASILAHGISPELVILSDDAGQFNVLGLLHALCWIHAERTINKLIPFSDQNRIIQEQLRDQIWTFYQDLKQYKLAPLPEVKATLAARFDAMFLQKTCFQTLNLALARIYQNKAELLLVLDRPEIPLHNNLSENDIRDYVKKRKISATTRSDLGRQARDTFLSLKKTCQKLGVSFWEYLQDRLTLSMNIPPLPSLISAAAGAP